MSLITAISWLVVYPGMLHIDNDARATQLREAHEKRSTLRRPPVKQ